MQNSRISVLTSIRYYKAQTVFFIFTIIFPFFNIQFLKCQQNEGNWWYFGNYAGLDFSSGSPVAVTNSAMYTNQGCATISDASGNLLFYTNGVSVWNKNHIIMPNGSGLLGNASSTQSSIIVKKPGSNNIYYIFTVPASGSGNLSYSEIDMTLQGGLGDVTSQKNILLSGPVTEKVTAVKHCNNTDIWVITHLWNSNAFHAYLVTTTGINTTPVVSNTGTVHSGSSNYIGYLKASPDGTRLACAIRYMNIFELFNFNNNTGQVSNPMTSPANYSFTYGIEFSPDATKLYVSCGVGTNQIWQFNLTGGTPASVFGSATLVGSPSGASMGALQLGPDGKIYAARYYQNYLGVINNPNNAGTGCNYIDNAVFLSGKQSQLGLPTFVQSLFSPVVSLYTNGNLNNFSDTCFNDVTGFALSSTYGIQSIAWNFGDPNSGASNTSASLNPSHVFSAPGTYNVSAILQFVCNPDTITRTVHILPTPYVVLKDTNICTGSSVTLNAGNPGAKYIWSTGATTQTILVSTSGKYSVTVSNSTCTYSDTCKINVGPYLPVNVPDDSICPGSTIPLNSGFANCSYIWNNNATTQIINITTAGNYSVTVTDPSGCSGADTITVILKQAPVVNLPVTGICPGDSIVVDAGNPGSTYLWNTGETTQTITKNNAGNYSVVVTNSVGCQAQASGTLSWYPAPLDNLPDSIILCSGDTAVLDAGNPGASYLWSNGYTGKTLQTTTGGLYSLTITSLDGCSISDSCFINLKPLPVINISDTLVCPDDVITFDAGNPGASYLWSIGTTNQTLALSSPGTYSVTVTDDNNCINTKTFVLTLLPYPEPVLGSDMFLCEMRPVIIDAGNTYNTIGYEWNTGEITREITAINPGLYTVTVTNTCGSTSDDILIAIDDTCSWSLYVPSAFTPNGDGYNDVFKALGSNNINKFKMIILDRWGEILFTSEDILSGWNGIYEGIIQPNALYTYIITFSVRNESAVRTKSGKFMLLR